MSLNKEILNQSFDFLFGYLNFKRCNFYSAINHNSFSSWRKDAPQFVEQFEILLKENLTTSNFSKLIYNIFTQYDLFKKVTSLIM